MYRYYQKYKYMIYFICIETIGGNNLPISIMRGKFALALIMFRSKNFEKKNGERGYCNLLSSNLI